MNIFATHEDPKQSAREHCYRHVVKMILEYSQLLSTAHRVLDGDDYADSTGLMKKTHINHPSGVWTRNSSYHYKWLFTCLCELHKIYEKHSGKVHASKRILKSLGTLPANIPENGFELPTPAMPETFKKYVQYEGVEVAYQKYLTSKFNEWLSRDKPLKVQFVYEKPSWYKDYLIYERK